jgi:hypothetical protein
MACRGVHFALNDDERSALLAQEDDDARLEFVQEQIEEELWTDEPERGCETDKAWDAIHRALTDGSLDPGDRSLFSRDDYVMSLKTPAQVREIASFLASVTEALLRKGYDRIDAGGYDGHLGDEDFAYTWEWFQALRDFYVRAATAGHHVLFTVDQ